MCVPGPGRNSLAVPSLRPGTAILTVCDDISGCLGAVKTLEALSLRLRIIFCRGLRGGAVPRNLGAVF